MVYQTYSAEFKINVVKEFLTYHGTLVSYCRLKNIKVSTFYPWLRKYRDYNNGLMDITNEVKGISLPSINMVTTDGIKKTFEVRINKASMVFDMSDLKIVLEALK